MANILSMSPVAVRDAMLANGLRRAFVVWDQAKCRPVASHALFQPVADHFLAINGTGDYRKHEGVFLEVGAISNSLFSAFIQCDLLPPAVSKLFLFITTFTTAKHAADRRLEVCG